MTFRSQGDRNDYEPAQFELEWANPNHGFLEEKCATLRRVPGHQRKIKIAASHTRDMIAAARQASVCTRTGC